MQPLKLTLTDYSELPNSKLIYFEGDFDGYAQETIAEIQSAVDQAGFGSTLIFEFSQLNYLNSFAIGQLVSWRTIMETKHGEIVVVGINKNIQDIFNVLGIGNLFRQYPDLAALKKLAL